MAKKNFYAVKRGRTIGIFNSWTECQASIAGYSNAEFQGFATKEEAENYLAGSEKKTSITKVKENIDPLETRLIAYVDGSYDDSLKKYSFGCVFLLPSGDIIKESGNGDNPESVAIRNVAGEMLGAMYAVKWAIANNYSEVEIRYDYAGIEKWAVGEWRAKNSLAAKYAEAIKKWQSEINILFSKVVAHSNNKYNDMADELAKEALIKGKGIPQIKRGDYWFTG